MTSARKAGLSMVRENMPGHVVILSGWDLIPMPVMQSLTVGKMIAMAGDIIMASSEDI